MATPSAIRLNPGIVVERGEPLYLSDKSQYCNYYLVDHPHNKTICALTEDEARAILGRSTSSQSEIDELKGSLAKQKVLAGDFNDKSAFALSSQKLLLPSIPLPFKPDPFITKIKVVGKILFNQYTIFALIAFTCFGLFIVSRQYNAFLSYTADAFSISYLMEHGLQFGAAFVLLRVFHEMAHALACKNAGGYAEGFVITFIAEAPLPSTKMNMLHKATVKQRVWISLAGIYIELWISAIALFLWLLTPDGELRALWHYLAVINPVLTLGANLIPVMKFDGYHFWSAVLKNPKLYEMAMESVRPHFEKLTGGEGYIKNHGLAYEKALPIYGLMIIIWKTFMIPLGLCTGMLMFFENDRFAYIFIAIAVTIFWIKPLIKEVKTMLETPTKITPVFILTMTVLIVLGVWLIMPLNHVDSVPGSITFEKTIVTAPGTGQTELATASGRVKAGDQLAVLSMVNIKEQMAQLSAQQAKLTFQATDAV